MFWSLAVGFPRDIQPIRATLVGACASARSGVITPRTIMRRNVTCLGLMVPLLPVLIVDAERWRSPAAGSGSEERADAVSSQVQRFVRQSSLGRSCLPPGEGNTHQVPHTAWTEVAHEAGLSCGCAPCWRYTGAPSMILSPDGVGT